MNWLAFLSWLFFRTRTQRCAALARAWLGCVLRDLARYPNGHADPAADRCLREACGQLIFLSHILVSIFIHRRAREIAGLKPLPFAFDPDAAPRRLASYAALRKRAAELFRRLIRAEQHARKLADKLSASALEDILGALSSRIPRAGGGPVSRVSANWLCRLLRVLRTRAGRPPSRAKRLMGFAIRDGPALAA
jgi:hypothetical protein